MSRHGKLFILAAPSGAGKTSLVNALVARLDRIRISISYTTRAKRPGDKEGVHYYFVDEAEFLRMVDQGAFLEHAQVFGYRYATSRRWVLDQLERGIDLLLEIDWQGARQVRERFPETCSIFLLPPSLLILEQRLTQRGQDDPQVIAARMAKSQAEMQHYSEFDYLVINQEFDLALAELQHIVLAERLRLKSQQREHTELLAQLLRND